jgi:beta propeller repeat protein
VFNSSANEFAVTNLTLNQESPRTDGQYVVWQARQADGNWDIWVKNLTSSEPAIAVTQTITSDEINPVIEWPWVVYQSKPLNNPTAPWQLYAKNLITKGVQVVDASTQDQLDPSISNQQIVWQDFRDVGAGEIYLQNLISKKTTRITQNTAGQYHPKIKNQWIVWEDNRDTQIDLYGYNLLRGVEIQLTNTPEDETHPDINDQWVVYEEDLSGEQQINLRMLLLSNKASVQLTNAASPKRKPFLVSGNVVWTDQPNGYPQALMAKLPDIQPVFNNSNMIVVTQGLVDHMPQASALLRLWQKEAGVVELVSYPQLVPELNTKKLTWDNGSINGEDFSLSVGDFIWVRFNDAHILDFADSQCKSVDFSLGINTLSSACFPDNYTAYQLLKGIGIARVNALRTLNAETGRWQVATVVNGRIVGEDFKIPRATVVLLDMAQSLNGWQP